MRLTRIFLRLLGALAVAGALASNALAQGSGSIKIITPFTAGTGYDTIARAVGTRLSEKLGTPVVVQNMPGASGNIGTEFVARAAADGNTILMGGNTMLIASQLYKNVPFHPLKDFAPVSLPPRARSCWWPTPKPMSNRSRNWCS